MLEQWVGQRLVLPAATVPDLLAARFAADPSAPAVVADDAGLS